MRLREYFDRRGRSPFAEWFDDLPAQAALRISGVLARMEAGNLSKAKSVGEGIIEVRIDTGPGYRIYFGRDGEELIILLAGGTKRRQQDDIYQAKMRWQDYKRQKKEATKWP